MAIQNGDTCKFAEADQDWNLESLFSDIEAKQLKKVTPAQQRNLRAILLGLSPQQVSNQLRLGRKSLDPAFSALYRLIEDLTDQPDTSVTYKNAPLVLAKYRKGAAPNTKFDLLGREVDRQKLEEFIKQYKIVLIKAGAGVGKSTLAREFLQTQFKKVIRIEMGLESGNVTPAEEKVSQILRKDFDEEPSRDFMINLDILREKLADRENSIGVLIDNLEPALDENYRFREKLRGYDALLAVLGDRDVYSFTLITSRRSLIATRAKVHEYSLEGLDITAWRQYFHDCENGADSEALMQMRDAYNGNAKVMDILHSAIKNRFDGNIRAYWNRYKDALLADTELETLISVEMDWLRDNQPDAYKLLCRMGCYRYQDVKTVPFEGLICLLWDIPESRQVGVVDYLSKTSMIEVKSEYYLHPAVRECAKKCLVENIPEWELVNLAASDFYYSTIKEIKSPEDGLILLESFHHAITGKDLAKAVNLVLPKIDVKHNVIRNPLPISKLRAFGYILQAISCLEKISNEIDKIDDPIILADIYAHYGDLHAVLGNFKQAIIGYKNSLEISKNTHNKFIRLDHSVDTKGALSLLYVHTGDYVLAKKLFDETLQDANKLGEEGNKYLCYIHACLSFLYSQDNKHSIAKQEISKSIQLIPSLENCSYTWIRSYGLYYLIRSLIYYHMFTESTDLLKKLQLFAITHSFELAQNLALLAEGYLYITKGDYLLGIQCFLHSEKGFQKSSSNYELADTYCQIGLTYHVMGEYKNSEKYKAKSLVLFEEIELPNQIIRVNKAFVDL